MRRKARSWLKTDILDEAAGDDNIIYIGFAADEQRRANQSEYTKKKNRYRFPLIDWGFTEADCLQYLKDIDLWNPLYDFFPRLGCFWYPKQPLAALENLYLYFPEYWEVLKEIETAQGRPFKHRYAVAELEARFTSPLLTAA